MLWPDYDQWPKGETHDGLRCGGLSIGFGSAGYRKPPKISFRVCSRFLGW